MRTLCLLVSTFLAGCGATIVIDDAGNPGEDGVTLGASCDKPGALACNGSGQKLQLLCDGAHWIQNGVCAGSLICDPRPGPLAGSCQEPLAPCVAHGAGSSFCDGAVRKTCAPDLLSTTGVDCGSAALCASSKTAGCAACAEGAHSCAGPVLKVCKGGVFASEKTCEGTVCDQKAGACRPKVCEPDAWRCNGNTLQHCNVAGSEWDTVSLCGGDCDAAMHQCVACPYMGKDCVGDVPRTCGALGSWILAPACAGACVAGECVAPGAVCVGGEYRCSGDTLERCLDDGSAFVGAATCSPGTCDAASKSCGAGAYCSTPGMFDCAGDTPRLCDDFNHYLLLTPCTGTSTPICYEGKCTETSVGKVIFPGKTSMTYDGVSVTRPLNPTLTFTHAGAYVEEWFPRKSSVSQVVVDFQMYDDTLFFSGCAGKTLSWDVYVGSTRVGAFSWVTGTASTQTVSQTFTFGPLPAIADTVSLHYEATTEIAPGCSGYRWVPGGSATFLP